MVGLYEAFGVFCVDIVRGEKHLEPNVEYLDDLEVGGYIKIQEILSKKVSEVINSKKG